MGLFHKHKYGLPIFKSVEHTYVFNQNYNDVMKFPYAIIWDNDAKSKLTNYSISSMIYMRCEECGKIKSEYHDGDWSKI